MPSPGILRNLRIKRVALVDVGANLDKETLDGAHIMLYKRDTSKNGPAIGSVHVDGIGDERDEYEKATIDSESRNKLPDSAFAAVWTDAEGKKQRKLPIHDAGHLAAARGRIDAADIPASVKADARHKIEAAGKHSTNKEYTVKDLFKRMLGLATETDVAKRTAAAAELEAEINKMDDPNASDGPPHKPGDPMCKCKECVGKAAAVHHAAGVKDVKDILDAKAAEEAKATKKALDDVTKRGEEIEKSNIELRKALEVEKNIRLDREMLDVLKSFKATPFNVDLKDEKNDVAKFRKMKETSPEAFDRTMEILKGTDAQLASSALFKNVGAGGSGSAPGGAWAQIEAKADQFLEKNGETKLTREQVLEKVMLQNPKLVAQYRAEMQ